MIAKAVTISLSMIEIAALAVQADDESVSALKDESQKRT
jgi:hypothetical protein